MYLFLPERKILCFKQFGFQNSCSTSYALLSIVDRIKHATDNRDNACGAFLDDLSKAFDAMNHDILIKKLEFYGIRGHANKWFLSYLTCRRQFVSTNNISSEGLISSYRVPQGSVLGPLLFLLYINDFANCATTLDFHIFADDSNLFFSSNNLLSL